MTQSIWQKDMHMPEFDQLHTDRKTNILIIGGGICGILCAYFLQQAGVDYILLEGGRAAEGITKNTTAKITVQHGAIYSKLIRTFGEENAGRYLAANSAALAEYAQLCKNIDCDFVRLPAYTYSLDDRKKIEDEVSAANRLGARAEFCEHVSLPFDIAGAVRFADQAQFNPLKFLAAIAKDLNIYENTFVREIKDNTAFIENARITADKIIVATHFPFINKYGAYFLKLYQHRSYVMALKNCPDVQGMYVDEAEKGMSFRNYNGRLFIGGGGHRTGKQGGGWHELHNFAKKYYPEGEVEEYWATQDCMSLDSIPYIGCYSRRTPDLLVATGFNKWGMTSAMAAARIVTDMAMGKENEYAEVFSPQRSILKPQLLVNGFEAAANLLTPTPKRCPHLGCALKWNKAEHTWDCPCHGSRFQSDGTLIDNPATGDANI